MEQNLNNIGIKPEFVQKRHRQPWQTVVVRSLRLHQWLKNLLVFVPLATSISILKFDLLLNSVLAFFAFGIAASAVYIINDLIDLESDRLHFSKRERPFASGQMPIWFGFFAAPILILTSISVAQLFLPATFTIILILYLVLTLLYSFYLKQKVLIDVIILAGLYTLRIIAGSFAVGVELSFWLLAFSMFVFLSLALIKRFTELVETFNAGNEWTAERGYKSSDTRLLMSFGTSSGYLAILVLAQVYLVIG